MNWYEKITDREIENLKENSIRLDMLDAESSGTGRNMRRIPHGLVEYWAVGGAGWEKSANNGESLFPVMTYRLLPDWERPEPEWYDGMSDCELETLQNNEVSLGDLVEVKTYIQNKGWEWLGLIGTVTSVGDEKRCYRVNYGDVYSFYDSDQIRKANSDISR
jgi:hypothetical protein